MDTLAPLPRPSYPIAVEMDPELKIVLEGSFLTEAERIAIYTESPHRDVREKAVEHGRALTEWIITCRTAPSDFTGIAFHLVRKTYCAMVKGAVVLDETDAGPRAFYFGWDRSRQVGTGLKMQTPHESTALLLMQLGKLVMPWDIAAFVGIPAHQFFQRVADTWAAAAAALQHRIEREDHHGTPTPT